jgi:hypothetical protein
MRTSLQWSSANGHIDGRNTILTVNEAIKLVDAKILLATNNE